MKLLKRTGSVVFVSFLSGAAVAILLINLFYGGTRLTKKEYESLGRTAAVAETLEFAEKTFYGELPEEETLVSAAAHGMVAALNDPYARYYTADEYEAYLQSLSGEYVGIGVTIKIEEVGVQVVEVKSGSPAENAGILLGDILIEVDGANVSALSLDEISALVMGEEGKEVQLTFLRDGEKIAFNLIRAKQMTQQVHHEMLDGNIGYILIERFSGDCEEGFLNALSSLKEQGMKALILDVRNNPGGSLDTVVAVADALLPEGVIVTVKSADGEEEVYPSDENCLGLPIAMITNGNSASASELLAGAVQDSDAGIVVGTKTYGKGVVQTTWSLPQSGSWLKLTTAAYYTPNGRNIDGEGITPDICVELPDELAVPNIATLDREQDTQFAAAREWILTKLRE